jgi:hypothetical protein
VAEIIIDLKKNGLTHASGKSDRCEGQHRIRFSLDEEGLHVDGDCLTEGALAALQKLHEAVHPQGAVSVLYCRDPACSEIVDELSSDAS